MQLEGFKIEWGDLKFVKLVKKEALSEENMKILKVLGKIFFWYWHHVPKNSNFWEISLNLKKAFFFFYENSQALTAPTVNFFFHLG
jgi:hypothetical protein